MSRREGEPSPSHDEESLPSSVRGVERFPATSTLVYTAVRGVTGGAVLGLGVGSLLFHEQMSLSLAVALLGARAVAEMGMNGYHFIQRRR